MGGWRWILWLAAITAGAIALPVGAYVVGGRLAGPYPGPRGLASYLGAIYGDALRGSIPALVLLLAPAAILLVWQIRASVLRRRLPATASEGDG